MQLTADTNICKEDHAYCKEQLIQKTGKRKNEENQDSEVESGWEIKIKEMTMKINKLEKDNKTLKEEKDSTTKRHRKIEQDLTNDKIALREVNMYLEKELGVLVQEKEKQAGNKGETSNLVGKGTEKESQQNQQSEDDQGNTDIDNNDQRRENISQSGTTVRDAGNVKGKMKMVVSEKNKKKCYACGSGEHEIKGCKSRKKTPDINSNQEKKNITQTETTTGDVVNLNGEVEVATDNGKVKKECYACGSGEHEIKGCKSRQNIYITYSGNDYLNKWEVKRLMREFGGLRSVRIKKDNKGRDTNTGMVCFSRAEEAAHAIRELNMRRAWKAEEYRSHTITTGYQEVRNRGLNREPINQDESSGMSMRMEVRSNNENINVNINEELAKIRQDIAKIMEVVMPQD